MELTSAMQELLLGMLLYGDKKDVGVVRALVPPDAFDVHYRRFAKAAVTYFDRYGESPGEHAHEVVDSIVASTEADKKIYRRILESIDQAKDHVNRDYVIESAASFEHFQRIRAKVADVLDTLESDPTPQGVEKSAGLLAEAAKSPKLVKTDDIDMQSAAAVASLLVEEDEETLEIGVPPFDRWKAGPERGALNILIGAPSAGKSWWCIHLGKQALRQGWRVCHVTLEISSRNTARRYLQAIHNVTKRKVDKINKTKLIKDENGLVIDVHNKPQRRPGLDKLNRQSRKRMLAMSNYTRLRVKGFPSGSLTMQQLEGYLDVLEVSENFVPDLLIIDYIDEMAIDARNLRLETGGLYTAVRGLAQKRNLAAVSVSQANKEAETARWVKRGNAAEAFSKIAKADVGFTFSQRPSERAMGLGRLSLIRARNDGGVGTRCVISQSYETGQFITDWALMEDEQYFDVLGQHGAADDDG